MKPSLNFDRLIIVLLVILSSYLLPSCVKENQLKEDIAEPNDKQGIFEKNEYYKDKRKIDDIVADIVAVIAKKYYDYNKKRVIYLKIENVVGRINKAPSLPLYIKKRYEDVININHHQIKQVEKLYDCKLSTFLYENNGIPMAVLSLIDNNNNSFYSSSYKLSDIEINDSNRMKKNISNVNLSTLNISYKSLGLEKKIRWTNNSYYPINIKFIIDGILCNESESKLIVKQLIPGKHIITVSFKGAEWDGYSRQQKIVTKKMEKTFEVFLNENSTNNISVEFTYTPYGGKIIVKPFNYLSEYSPKGELITSKKMNYPKYKFSKKEIQNAANLIEKYSKNEIIEMIFTKRGIVTIEVDNEIKEYSARPHLGYTNERTILIDLRKNNLSIHDAEDKLDKLRTEKIVQLEYEEKQRRLKEERLKEEERIRKIKAQIEENNRIAEEKRRKEEALRRKKAEKKQYLDNYNLDKKKQRAPYNYERKIRKYLHHNLKDPYSLVIESISKPYEMVLDNYWLNLSPGNIIYKSEVCYNAKNSFGGYVGVQCHEFYFRDGEIVYRK